MHVLINDLGNSLHLYYLFSSKKNDLPQPYFSPSSSSAAEAAVDGNTILHHEPDVPGIPTT